MDLACFHIPDFSAWALARRWCEGDSAPAVAVCEHGRILARTPALHRDVAVGDPVDRARRLAPWAQFLLRDPAVERALWDHVLFQLYRLTPQVQPIPDPLRPVDRRIGGRQRRQPTTGDLFSDPVASVPLDREGLARGLWDNGAWAWLEGPDHPRLEPMARQLGGRVGVSSGRSWALLAAAYADTGAITTVPAHMITPFLGQAPIELLETLRYTSDMVQRLQLFGVRAVGHAMHMTRRQLQAQFGDEGARLFELLHPPEVELPVADFDPRVAQAHHDFEWPVFEPGELQPVLHHLLAQLVTTLDGRSARHIEVCLRGRSAHHRTASRILREPTRRLDVLRTAADVLLMDALTSHPPASSRAPSGRSVQRLRVTLSGLTEVPAQQASLFGRRSDLFPALVRAMDNRFPGKLLRPVRAHADPFFPEEEYRFEPVAR
jgi:hypothetical protein